MWAQTNHKNPKNWKKAAEKERCNMTKTPPAIVDSDGGGRGIQAKEFGSLQKLGTSLSLQPTSKHGPQSYNKEMKSTNKANEQENGPSRAYREECSHPNTFILT